MEFELANYWQRQMFAGCHERREFWFIRRLLRQGDVFIDGGANIGYYTCLAASVVGPGCVHAFEPNPLILPQLRRQAEINPHLNIRMHPLALSDREGEATFYVPQDRPEDQGWHSGMGTLEPVVASQRLGKPVRVMCTTLDRFVGEQQCARVTLCKLDLEGGESAALRGAQNALKSGVLESVILEITPQNRERIMAELQPYEFDLILDVGSLRVVRSVAKMRWGVSDVLLARGACAERAKQLGWDRWLM